MPDREPRRWFNIVRAAASDSATIRIYGEIGMSWWDDEAVSAGSFVKELDDVGPVGTIDLHLNSPGGDAFDGVTIGNALRDHPANVVVHVDGLAASAASIIAMAGDEVIMGRGSQMMIHDAASWAAGFPADLRKVADDLDHISDSMADVYADHAGGTTAEWREIMRAETWYSDREAVEAGLATRVAAKKATEDDGDADVAAMLRRSPVAASFRFKGRAQAPPPRTPVRATGGPKTEGGSVEVSEEDFAALRERLGLPEDAAIADVLDALEEHEDTAPTPAPAAAKLPEGVVAIDSATLAQLQADASMGREARMEQARVRQAAKVDAAIRAGKVQPARRAAWVKNLAADEDGYTAALDGLATVFATVETGYDDGPADSTPSTYAEVRETAAYKGWKVV